MDFLYPSETVSRLKEIDKKYKEELLEKTNRYKKYDDYNLSKTLFF